MKVCWPIFGAVQGVAGAKITSQDLNSFKHARAIPAAEILRFHHQRRWDHSAGEQAVAYRRVKFVRPVAQAVEMQRRAFGGGDHIGCGTGAPRLGNFDLAARAERLGDAVERRSASGKAPSWK